MESGSRTRATRALKWVPTYVECKVRMRHIIVPFSSVAGKLIHGIFENQTERRPDRNILAWFTSVRAKENVLLVLVHNCLC
jgi:hypothetical protein